MEIVLGVLLAVGLVALVVHVLTRESLSADYDRAMMEDMRYAKEHPGCTWEEAHREREKVYRKHGL